MRAARTDRNQTTIVQGLRGAGASVTILSMVGNGVPDILVGFRGINYLMEIKDWKKPPSKRKLTPLEQEFFDTWRGQVDKIETLDDALSVIGAL